MCANIARKQFGHEQGRSGITNPSRPGHGGGYRTSTTRHSGGLYSADALASKVCTACLNLARKSRRTTAAIVLCLMGLPCVEAAQPETVLRERTIDRGLVFDRAAFLPGPYVVAQTEEPEVISVRLAGLVLDQFRFSASAQPVPPPPVEAPPLEYEVAEGADKLAGSGYPLYLHLLLKYHSSRSGIARALELAEQHARSSPLVTRVERREDGLLLFDEYNDVYFVGESPSKPPAPLTREQAVDLAARAATAYEKLLSNRGAILHFDGMDIFLPLARVKTLLIPSLRIIAEPRRSTQGKEAELSELWEDAQAAKLLLARYRHTAAAEIALSEYENGGEP